MDRIIKKTTTLILAVLFVIEMIAQPFAGIISDTNVSVVEAAGPSAPVAPANLNEWRNLSDDNINYLSSNLSAFDARDYGVVPAIKNQGQTNLCWAYGSTSAIEISMLKEGFDESKNKDNLNFYEKNAAYRVVNKNTNPFPGTTPETFYNDSWNAGRTQSSLYYLYTQWRGPVEYKDAGDMNYLGDDFTKYLMESSIRLPSIKKGETDKRRLYKEFILKYGAVSVAYHHNPSPSVVYWNADGSFNMEHQVAIIGWDDNISADKFYPKPSVDGAWLIRDSWGSSSHNNGYFWLSYDSFVKDSIVYDFGPMKYDYNYYYDTNVNSNSAFKIRQSYVMAGNIYRAVMSSASKQEVLKAVNVALLGNNINVEISVYKGLKGINSLDTYSKSNVPVQGAPVSTMSKTFEYMGNYTIDLDTPVVLDKGEYFSIVVKVNNPSKDASIFYANETDNSTNDLSYYYVESKDEWINSKINEGVNSVARIKGYTVLEDRTESLTASLEHANVIIGGTNFIYDGKEKRPEVKVSYEGKLLVENEDYVTSYVNNKEPGIANVYVTGLGEFDGQVVEGQFRIERAEYPLGGNPKDYIKHVVYQDEVTYVKELPLADGWEYVNPNKTISSFETNKEYPLDIVYKAGDAGCYEYTNSRTYIEVREGKREPNVKYLYSPSLLSDTFIYTGAPIRPEVSLMAHDITEFSATYGADYIVNYVNNINPGIGEAIIRGIGGYEGEFRLKFNIIPNEKISILPAQLEYQYEDNEYAFSPVCLPVKVTLDGKVLEKGKDITIGYANNNKAGRGRIIIEGIGDYEGTIVCGFGIIDTNGPTTDVNPSVEADGSSDVQRPVAPVEVVDSYGGAIAINPGNEFNKNGLENDGDCNTCMDVKTNKIVDLPKLISSRNKSNQYTMIFTYRSNCTICTSLMRQFAYAAENSPLKSSDLRIYAVESSCISMGSGSQANSYKKLADTGMINMKNLRGLYNLDTFGWFLNQLNHLNLSYSDVHIPAVVLFKGNDVVPVARYYTFRYANASDYENALIALNDGRKFNFNDYNYADEYALDIDKGEEGSTPTDGELTPPSGGTVIPPSGNDVSNPPSDIDEEECEDCEIPMFRHDHEYSDSWKTNSTNHWHACNLCGRLKDNASHALKTTVTKASFTTNGKKETKCSVCKKVTDSSVIYAPKTIALSKTAYTYDGKNKRPSVIVKDTNGKNIQSKYVTVSYPKKSKDIGKYTVKITFKESSGYIGTKKLYYKINPPNTKLKSFAKKAKSIGIKWEKSKASVSGYEIMYSTNGSFAKNTETVNIKGKNKSSVIIKSLRPNQKYYIKIRTYKNVSGKKYVSDWSKSKMVKTKK